MSLPPTPFKPTAKQRNVLPKEHSIRSFIRNKILNGEFKAGTSLPPMQELARMWESNYFTVHKALTPLVQEGLLERHKGVGTFVAETRRKVQTIGIYYGADIISNPGHGFAIQLHRLLYAELQKHGLKTHTWLEPRGMEESATCLLPELSWAVEHQHVQAMIAIMVNQKQRDLLRKLSLPIVQFGGNPGSHSVYFPNRDFLNLTLQRCRKNGVKTLAVITSPSLMDTPERKHPWTEGRAFSIFQNLCLQNGITTKKSWFHPVNSGVLTKEEERRKILESYRSIIKAPVSQRPEALFIFPDNNLVNLDASLSELGELWDPNIFVISHRNEPLAFPMPAGPHYIALSLASVAESLVQLVMEAVKGLPCPSVPGKLTEAPPGRFF